MSTIPDNPEAITGFISDLISKHPDYDKENFVYEFKCAVGRRHQLTELTLFMRMKREAENTVMVKSRNIAFGDDDSVVHIEDKPEVVAAFITDLVNKHPLYEKDDFIREFQAAVGRKHQLGELTTFMKKIREVQSSAKNRGTVADNPEAVTAFITDLVDKHPLYEKDDFIREFQAAVGRKHKLGELTEFMKAKREPKKQKSVPDNREDIAKFISDLVAAHPEYEKEDFVREFNAAVKRKHQLSELTLFMRMKRELTVSSSAGSGGKSCSSSEGAVAEIGGKEHHAPPANLPKKWPVSAAEKAEQQKRWATFADFMAKPYTYQSKYNTDLQAMDALGCLNVHRVTRQVWPEGVEMHHVACVFFCPYEGLENELCIETMHANIVDDAALVAKTYLERGYRVLYCKDPTVTDLITWFDFVLERAENDIMLYFIGYSKKIIGGWTKGVPARVESCLLLYNEARKKDNRYAPPMGQTGATTDTVTEGFLYDMIGRLDFPDKKVTLIFDLYELLGCFMPGPTGENATVRALGTVAPFPDNLTPALRVLATDSPTYTFPVSARLTPPPGVVLIEVVLNLDWMHLMVNQGMRTVAKGASFSGYIKGQALPESATHAMPAQNKIGPAGTDYSSALAATLASVPKERGFFSTINSFGSSVVNAVKNCFATATIVSSPTVNPATVSIAAPLPPQEVEVPVQQAIAVVAAATPAAGSGSKPATNPVLAPAVLSPVEIQGAEERWKLFTEEMKKPPTYTSMYREKLVKLDQMGAMNLDRITRQQIPKIRIDRVVALFFCPYEKLPHTLDAGPPCDAVSIATLYISRGYKIVYLCDATPKEYYIWMDWLLDNVHYEIVSFFSGHGMQVRDYTGKEKDGLSELMVFYEEGKKKDSRKDEKKIAIKTGITTQTVSDDVMHSLIVSKDYPETRVVLISDCCHSGTLFDFDQPLEPDELNRNVPLNVVCIGAAQDNQTAKQIGDNGVFTTHFVEALKKSKDISFEELEKLLNNKQTFKKYQNLVVTSSDPKLCSQSVIVDAK